MIADLVRRRDEVLDDTEELSGKLTTAVGDHRPAEGADPFDVPDELDPRRARGARRGPTEVAEDEPFDADEEAEPDRGRGGARGGARARAGAGAGGEAEAQAAPLPQGPLLILGSPDD